MSFSRTFPVVLCFSLLGSFSALAEEPAATNETEAYAVPELSPALQSLNGRMHAALQEVVILQRQQLGPLIMFEEGEMKLYRGDEEVAGFSIIPPLAYDQLKIIGHAAFSVVIQAHRTDLSSEEKSAWFVDFQRDLSQIRTELPSFDLPKDVMRSQRKLIDLTLEFTEQIQQQSDPSEVSTDIRAYTDRILPLLQKGFAHSAHLHVDLIHRQGEKLYALLTPEERAYVRGYFYGGRGARVGNLALQYVSWLLGERTGEESERVIFTEGVLERDRAMIELAKFRVERELAELVFGDPAGLHRDVLSEATRAYLATFPDVIDAFGVD